MSDVPTRKSYVPFMDGLPGIPGQENIDYTAPPPPEYYNQTTSTRDSGLANLLANIKGTGESNPVTVDDVNNYNFGLSPDQEQLYNQSQEQFRPVSQPLGVHDYYPNQGDPIGVGQSSGRIIGTQTQYVPNGGLVPIGMWDARDAAIQKAAMAKAKDVADWKAKNAKAPTSKLTNINDNLTKEFFKFQDDAWRQAVKAARGDQSKAKYMLEQSGDYQAKTKAFYDHAANGDAIFQHKQRILDDAGKGKIITPFLQKNMDYLSAAEDSSTEEFKNSGKAFMGLKVADDFNDTFNTIVDKLKMEKMERAGVNTNDPDAVEEWKVSNGGYTDDQKEAVVQSIYRNYGANSEGKGGILNDGYISAKEIRDNVYKMMSPKTHEESRNWQAKPQNDGSGYVDYSSIQPLTETEQNIKMPDGRQESVYGETAYSTTGRDEKLVLRLPISQSMRDSQGQKVSGKSLGESAGYIQGTVSKIQNMPYDVTKSRYLFGTEVKKLKEEGNYYGNKNLRLKPRGVVNLDRPKADEGSVSDQNSVYVNVDEFKGKFKNNKKSAGQKDFDDRIDDLKKEADAFNSKSEQNQAKGNASKKAYTPAQLEYAKKKNPGVSEKDLIEALENR